MKKILCLIAAAVALPMALHAETWKNVSTDGRAWCAAKADARRPIPDAHSKTCAIQREKSGYGIVTFDGGFLKFDAAGNKQVEAELKATKKTDHLRVDVEGDLEAVRSRSRPFR